jgi:hypothetical protein
MGRQFAAGAGAVGTGVTAQFAASRSIGHKANVAMTVRR